MNNTSVVAVRSHAVSPESWDGAAAWAWAVSGRNTQAHARDARIINRKARTMIDPLVAGSVAGSFCLDAPLCLFSGRADLNRGECGNQGYFFGACGAAG